MPLPDERAELVPCLDFAGPRRALRWLYGAALLLTGAAIAAASATEVDVVVGAAAVVAPAGETARVVGARGGVVEAILAREGEAVARGQAIVRLDPRRAEAGVALLRARLEAAERRAEALSALAGARGALHAIEARMQGEDRRGAAAQAEAAAARAEVRAREREARAREAAVTQALVARGAEAPRALEDAELEDAVARAEERAAGAALRDLRATASRRGLEQERVRQGAAVDSLEDAAALAEVQGEIEALRGELADAELAAAELEIRAPRAGVLQGLTVFDPGDVIEQGRAIALVVPTGGELVVRAEVPAGGIASARPGQAARVKLDAYPFQDFGVFPGRVRRVAGDTARAGEAPRREATYAVEIALDPRPPGGRAPPAALRAGMTGQAELVVRREPLIAALLRPLRGRLDSVRE